MKRSHIFPAALSVVIGVPALAGCLFGPERMCSQGQYPVYALDNPTGAYCETNGQPPQPGFASYPPKRVPKVVGDQYDRWPLAQDYPWKDEVRTP
ncbi:hypothetical protein EDD33_1856 [Nocardioides aurantiacus]|uniref:Lipoprotein n=1 Tax=Nocardioides aurantiacus TaxID=86796 RepID=A0A3N2CUB9_9ACTN|nr:hypothetical protein EDD33_1856 [Nocardioides aurantiacus]